MTNRPQSLDNFIGQEHLVANLRVILGGAKARQKSAPHMLFVGPPGLGKTSLAEVIAAEMGTTMVAALGTMIRKPAEIATMVLGLNEGDVLFIDEVHAMPRSVYETLYTAVEDFHLDMVVGPKSRPRPIRVKLPHFTLVGATTHPGGISGPLRDRFGYVGKLEFYSTEELRDIVLLTSYGEGLSITPAASLVLASASRGTPRVAIRLYERARDVAQTRGASAIDSALAAEALDLADTDEAGLDATDRSVLQTLMHATGPIGLSTLAATLGEEESTIEAMVEPFLLRQGLIERLPNGRVITQAGMDALCS